MQISLAPFIFLVFSDGADILQAFHSFRFELDEVGFVEFGVMKRVVVARHFVGVMHHESSSHVHLSSNHSVLVPVHVTHDAAIRWTTGHSDGRLTA